MKAAAPTRKNISRWRRGYIFRLLLSSQLFILAQSSSAGDLENISGQVFLDGQSEHSGSVISATLLQPPQVLPASELPWLIPVIIALSGLFLLGRRRRFLSAMLFLLAAGIAAGGSFQAISDSAGGYEIRPTSGENFEAGTYQLEFIHEGYYRETRFLTVAENDETDLSVGPVTLKRVPTTDGDQSIEPPAVVPGLDPTKATNFAEATEFLYKGANPIQTGVSIGAIDRARVGVLRGRVRNRSGSALSDVSISVLNQPEFGTTRSRSDGALDLALNGGGTRTIRFSKAGYIPVDRQIRIPALDYLTVPDVRLTAYDVNVTEIDFSVGQMQVARGSVQVDSDGTRQATLLFPSTVRASLHLPSGARLEKNSLQVRATEMTVGSGGLEAMPASLPPNVAYSYLVELSADEAVRAGASSIEFSEPISLYVENFLNFPTGQRVPVGYYDREKGVWVALPNGRIVEILAIAGGQVDLDIDGDGQVDDAQALTELGITAEERQRLADLYSVGQSLWRMPISHFTPIDANWPFGQPSDAIEPVLSVSQVDDIDDPCEQCSSIIEVQNQVLGESLPVAGTPFTLNYRSNRVRGRQASFSLDIQVSEEEVPVSLQRIDVEVNVAGRLIKESLSPKPNQVYRFTWDGRDAFGRRVEGEHKALVRVGYVYEGDYQEAPELEQAFGSFSGVTIEGDPTRREIIFWKKKTATLGMLSALSQGLGGWTLSVHHAYDPGGKVLYLGTGRRQSIDQLPQTIETFVGSNTAIRGGGRALIDAELDGPSDVIIGPDGNLYISDTRNRRVLRVTPEGQVSTIAGTGEFCFPGECDDLGDGGPATGAKLGLPDGLAFGPDGSLYIDDSTYHNRLRRITPDGIIGTVAMTGDDGCLSWCSDESDSRGDVAKSPLCVLQGLAVGEDGSIYVRQNATALSRLRRITTDGLVTTVAGKCEIGSDGDGGPASEAGIASIKDVEIGPDGSIYIIEQLGESLRRIGNDGIIETIASLPSSGVYNSEMTIDAEGTVYIADANSHVIRSVDSEGNVSLVAGTGEAGYSGDHGVPQEAQFNRPVAVAVDSDGTLYVADKENSVIRRIGRPLFAGSNLEILIPNSDGREVYVFDQTGRHLRTVDALTGRCIWEFDYNLAGLLTSIVDRNGNTTLIERDVNEIPIAIVGPYGHRTELVLNPDGYLASTLDPAGRIFELTYYEENGLLATLTDPRSGAHSYAYDEQGLLLRDNDPVGGGIALERTKQANGYTVTTTSAEGRRNVYQVQHTPAGDKERINQCCDGLEARSSLAPSGKRINVMRDGTTTTFEFFPDPRFGMLVPIVSLATVTTPAGLRATIHGSRNTTLSNVSDPFSTTNQVESITINGRAFVTTSAFSDGTQTQTFSSPEGRQTVTTLNEKGRVIRAEVLGMAPILTTYDEHGRIQSVSQVIEARADLHSAPVAPRQTGAQRVHSRPTGRRLLAPVAVDTGNPTWGPPEGGRLNKRPQTRRSPARGAQTRTTTYTYGEDGYLASVTDPMSRVTTFQTDAIGQVTSATLPGGRVVELEYDGNSNVTEISPPGQPEHRFELTPVNLPSEYGPPDLGAGSEATTYEHNLDRQPTKETRPDGRTVETGYDNGGRLETLTTPHGQIVLTYEAETGNLATITAPGPELLSFTYDGSLPLTETWTGTVFGSVEKVFDNDFRVASQTVGGVGAVAFGYDQDGLLTSAGKLILNRDPQNGLIIGTTLTSVTDTFEYNPFGEVERYVAAVENAEFFEIEYERDALGRITRKFETIDAQTHIFEYFYDLSGRLERVEGDDALVAEYTYDQNGNRLTRTTLVGTETAFHDDQDRLLSYGDWTFNYSENGELESKTNTQTQETTLYEYDVFGNLRRVDLPDGRVVTYVVDGLNRRIGKMVDGELGQGWLYDGQLSIVAELDGQGQVVSRFIPGGMVRHGMTYRIIRDHLGSPRLVVNVTTGEIAQRMAFDEWGNVLEDTNPGFQPFGFAGGLWDADIGLVRFGARDYDPVVGRWTIKDLIQFRGGDTNLYSYSKSEPINARDRFGLQRDPFQDVEDDFFDLPDSIKSKDVVDAGRTVCDGKGNYVAISISYNPLNCPGIVAPPCNSPVVQSCILQSHEGCHQSIGEDLNPDGCSKETKKACDPPATIEGITLPMDECSPYLMESICLASNIYDACAMSRLMFVAPTTIASCSATPVSKLELLSQLLRVCLGCN